MAEIRPESGLALDTFGVINTDLQQVRNTTDAAFSTAAFASFNVHASDD